MIPNPPRPPQRRSLRYQEASIRHSQGRQEGVKRKSITITITSPSHHITSPTQSNPPQTISTTPKQSYPQTFPLHPLCIPNVSFTPFIHHPSHLISSLLTNPLSLIPYLSISSLPLPISKHFIRWLVPNNLSYLTLYPLTKAKSQLAS